MNPPAKRLTDIYWFICGILHLILRQIIVIYGKKKKLKNVKKMMLNLVILLLIEILVTEPNIGFWSSQSEAHAVGISQIKNSI